MIYILTVCVLILFLVMLWLSWNQGLRGVVLWFLIPFVVFNVGFGWHTLSELRGWPKYQVPHEHSRIIHVNVQKPWIYLTVQRPDSEPRLYAVPYSPEKAKQAQQAQHKTAQGHTMMIRKSTDSESGEFVIYEFNHLNQYQKD